MNKKIHNKYEESLEYIRSYLFKDINLPLPQEKEEALQWAIKFVRWFWELCLRRIRELLMGYSFAKKKNNKLIMALCARAALETISLEIFHIIKLEKFSKEGKWKEFYELCLQLHLGYRDSTHKEKVKAKNILTYIEAYDKYLNSSLLKITNNYSMRQLYDDLSNICHPNWLGVEYIYSRKNKKLVQEDPIFTAFEIIIVLARYHDEHIKELEKFTAEFIKQSHR